MKYASIIALLFATSAQAGGYDSASPSPGFGNAATSAVMNQSLTYQNKDFRVDHQDGSGVKLKIGPDGESANAYGYSLTTTQSDKGLTSWKKTRILSKTKAENGQASGSNTTATFLKVQTEDGRYFMYKGLSQTKATLSEGGKTTEATSTGKAASGQIQ